MVRAHCVLPLTPACGLGGLARDVVSTFFAALAGWFVDAASWMLTAVGAVLESSTAPPVTTAWFLHRQQGVLAVAAPIALLALVAASIHAVVHGTGGELVRTVAFRLPVAVVLGAASAGVVGIALAATDQLSTQLAAGDGTSLTRSLGELGVALQAAGGLPGAVGAILAVLVIVGALVLWVELVVRAAAITVVTALLPLVFAASLWPPGVAWARRLVETLGALIVSKAVIVLVLSLALDAVAHAGAGAATIVTGGALLVLATFMPFALLKLVPAFESAAVSHLEAVRHRASAATKEVSQRAVSMALAGAGAGAVPGVDPVGSDPVGMMPGITDDIITGTVLDPDATFVRSRPPIKAVPASAGTHVWDHDKYGPKLVWKPPGHAATP